MGQIDDLRCRVQACEGKWEEQRAINASYLLGNQRLLSNLEESNREISRLKESNREISRLKLEVARLQGALGESEKAVIQRENDYLLGNPFKGMK